ncbi:MAG: SoxR reducing system RseC family protein [Dechloromonas sp.]|nr:MAG: SoxR reducing system RseC family protein [Dechloromonas sp.]
MIDESSTVCGIVRAVDGAQAEVEVEQGGCGRCHEKGGCGGQSLTRMFASGPRKYRVDNQLGATVGERVSIAIAAGSIRRSANLAYGVPLLAAIAGALAGNAVYGDLGGIGGAVGAFFLALFYVRRRSMSGSGNSAERPHIVSRS